MFYQKNFNFKFRSHVITKKAMKGITNEDVIQISNDLGFNPSLEQIKQAVEMYPSAVEQDPTGNWSEIVEQILYDLNVEKLN